MSQQTSSFSVKSSHRFVNYVPEQTYESDDKNNTSNLQPQKDCNKTQKSSVKGITIRTTKNSLEDFY